jgi:hypothetical protein
MRQWTHWLLPVGLALIQLAGCQKRAVFNPGLAGRFFPLAPGLTWTYQVTYPNGAHETISDHVVNHDGTRVFGDAVLVVSQYSDHGTRAVRADLPQSYPAEINEVETHYIVEGGYISRIASPGGRAPIRLEERHFLPQYLWPDRSWSNTLLPFAHSPDDVLNISQNHRSFLESDVVVVPAGRFSQCIRVETEAAYGSPFGLGDRRYFTDWYAPDVGLVRTIVSSGGRDGREMARIELLHFAKSEKAAPPQSPSRVSLVPLSSRIVKPAATVGPSSPK